MCNELQRKKVTMTTKKDDHAVELIRELLLERSRQYGWKDGDIARRFAEDVRELVEQYGTESTMRVIESLQHDWESASNVLDDAISNYGMGLDFWLYDSKHGPVRHLPMGTA